MSHHYRYVVRNVAFLRMLPVLLILAAVPAMLTPYAAAQSRELVATRMAGSFREYEIKAGFIYKFISFVSWPEGLPDDGRITIGIIGENPFGDAFKAIEGTTVGTRVVRVQSFRGDADYDDLKSCQLLYIASSQKKGLRGILEALAGSPVLTIGDTAGFVDQGGMIGFVGKDRKRVGIEINIASARRAGLTIRSMLKRIAIRIVDDPGDRNDEEKRDRF